MKISGSESEKEDDEISDRKGREKCVFESMQMRINLWQCWSLLMKKKKQIVKVRQRKDVETVFEG